MSTPFNVDSSMLPETLLSKSEEDLEIPKFSADVFHIDVPILYAFTNEMVANIDVLTSSMKNWVPYECYC
uniref:Uncharacterized protein n=1 Tax=Tanacetum cinerariifolium TaxID=118510 RepID=A0A699KVA0_TANCI|nr:hypothetical protein [Tanacetum cinerariifolium]